MCPPQKFDCAASLTKTCSFMNRLISLLNRRIYYGWIIVGTFFFLNIAGQASGTLNFGLLVIPLSDELGLNRQMIGWAQTARLWAGGASGLAIGFILDRFGPRIPVLISILIATAGLLILSQAQSFSVLFGVLLAFGLSGWTAPAGGSLIATVPVSKWFIRQRGHATGVVQIGLGFGGMILLPLTQMFITNHGWRSALVTLSWISLGALPLVFLLVRQPSDIGLVPDGESSSKSVEKPRYCKGRKSGEVSEKNWGLGAAIRTVKMWKLCTAWALLSFLGGAASVHRVAHWVEQGFSPTTVSLAFGLDAASATLMAFIAGFLVDRFPPHIIGAAACSLFCGSLVLMIVIHESIPLLFISGLLFGAAVGLSMVVQGVIWAHHYGSRYVGRIRGLVFPVTAFCGGLGAPLAGFLYDHTGSYRAAWSIVLAACFLSGLLMLSIRQTKHMN